MKRLLDRFIIELIITLGIGIFVRAYFVPFNFALIEIPFDLIIYTSVIVTIQIFKFWKLRYILVTLLIIYDETDKKSQAPFLGFLKINIDHLRSIIMSAFSINGVTVTIPEVDMISQLCFKYGRGVYNGTDSNPPSLFKKKYPLFLSYNQENIKKRDQAGMRVLLVDENELQKDFKSNADTFRKFYSWHISNNMVLLQVDPSIAKRISSEHSISSCDIGIWDNDYVVLFNAVPETEPEKVNLKIVPKEYESLVLDRCKNYFIDLLWEAKKIEINESYVRLSEIDLKGKETFRETVKTQWKQ